MNKSLMSFALLFKESKLDKRVLPLLSDLIGIKMDVLFLLCIKAIQLEELLS